MRAVVLAGDGAPAGLVDALGAARAARVASLMVERARVWALAACGGPSDAVTVREGERWAAALTGSVDEPLIACVPELPVWRPELVSAIASDLADGCAACVGPGFQSGAYLLAVGGDAPEVRARLGALDLSVPETLSAVIGAAAHDGWDVGLLRTERALRGADDVRALLADPMCDGDLRELLR